MNLSVNTGDAASLILSPRLKVSPCNELHGETKALRSGCNRLHDAASVVSKSCRGSVAGGSGSGAACARHVAAVRG